jgi:outer membrane receptor protein involved in Fe transport
MGGEYRSEKGRATGDPISAQNQYYYGNPKSFAGSYHVKEAFGEANIPLLRDAPFARELEVNLAGRWTDYSISGSVGTWKIGGVWQPLSALRFRVTRSRDIRAPNLSDLFTAARTQPTSVFDPVTKTTGFVPVLTAGNTALQPEKADTFTAGVVVQPPFLRTFRLSADYYDISVDGAITALTAQSIVNRCAAGETNLCDQITRNAAGNLTAINNALININTLNVRGIDIEASYSLPLRQLFGGDPGTLTFRGFATHTLRFDQSDGASVTHLAGMSGDQGVPSWLATLNLDYTVGAFSALVQTRFISSGKYNNAFTSTSINNNHTPAAAYVNLSMNYDLGHGSRQDVRIFGVINNLLDKDPVIAPPSQIGVTNLAYYDVIGRTFRAGLQFRF